MSDDTTPDDTDELPEHWPEPWLAALDDDALLRRSGAATFERGLGYAKEGAVRVIDEDPLPEPALRAQVSGSRLYDTEVWIENDALAGRCNCPSASGGGFCKHQVALALVWREHLARPDSGAVDPRQALFGFLLGQPASALADKLLALADGHPAVAREMQQWRQLHQAQEAPAELQALVDEMLTPDGFIGWRESAGHVQQAEAVLPVLQQARARDGRSAAELSLFALHRAWDAFQEADDSDGEFSGLCEAIGAEWVLALKAAGPQPAGFGETYLQLLLDDPFDSFDTDAAEAAFGEPALARYRSTLAERWRRAKDAVAADKAARDAQAADRKGSAAVDIMHRYDHGLWSLEHLHLAQLERSGQIDAALAVMRDDLSEAGAHDRVVRLLERHDRFDEALAQAEQGRAAFPHDQRLQDDLLRCWERAGRTSEALALRRQQFEGLPGVQRYQAVLKAAAADGQDVAAVRQALFEVMVARENEPDGRPALALHATGLVRAAALPGARDVTLRAEILGAEGRWTEACALVQPPATCRDSVLAQIARHLPTDDREQARALLVRVFVSAMRNASSPYREELALVREIGRLMGDSQRAAWLGQLRVQYKLKRNFVRDLP